MSFWNATVSLIISSIRNLKLIAGGGLQCLYKVRKLPQTKRALFLCPNMVLQIDNFYVEFENVSYYIKWTQERTRNSRNFQDGGS